MSVDKPGEEPGVPEPTLEQMAVSVLLALHSAIYSRESEARIDRDGDWRADVPAKKLKGVVWHDGEDPVVSFAGDWGPGNATVYYGTLSKPLSRHSHVGDVIDLDDPERNLVAFIRGLYHHFRGEGLPRPGAP